jgi:transcriptional regulator with XRE-family HTH domain
MNNEKTGMLIAQIRKEKGLTQKQLADRIGVSNATISKWETAKGFPDISLIEPLAEVLDISVSEIIAGERLESSPKTDDIISDLVDISINEQNRKKKIYNWIIAITVAILYLIISLITKNGNTRGLYGWLIAFSEWLRNMYLRNKYDTSKDKS